MENSKLGLVICTNYKNEIESIINSGKNSDIEILYFNPTCVNLSKSDIKRFNLHFEKSKHKFGKIIFLSPQICTGYCIKDSEKSYCNYQGSSVCSELIASKSFINQLVGEGNYITSPGWLKNWKMTVQKRWKFNETNAKQFFRDTTKQICVLDTEVNDNFMDELKEFSEFVGLDYKINRIGNDYFEFFVDKIITNWRYRQNESLLKAEIKNQSKKNADYVMAFDVIKDLSNLTSEKAVMENIFQFFTMLFSPQKLNYYSSAKDLTKTELPTSTYQLLPSGRGFNIYAIYNNELLGYIELDDILFPKHLNDYVGLIDSISSVFGLLIYNARHYNKLQSLYNELVASEEELKAANEELHTTSDSLIESYRHLETAKIKVEESNTRLDLVIRGSNDAPWDWDLLTDNFFYSPQWWEQLGYEDNEVPSDSNLWVKLMHPSDRSKVEPVFKDALIKGHESYAVEFRLQHKKGHYVPVLSRALITYDKEKKAVRVSGTNQNLTEQKAAEQKIKNQNKKLKELNATKDKFISVLAHDLKNPLTALIGFSDLLIKNIDKYKKEKVLKMLHSINSGSTNTYHLLINLLEWARAKQNLLKYTPKRLNLYLIVQECYTLVYESAILKKIKINIDVPEEITVIADADMIKTVIRNLISNAVKFTPENGSITISAKKKNNLDVELSVSDTGLGMNKKTLNTLFNIGETISTRGTNNEKGTGFGLLLCKEYIEKHGGKIWAESTINKGSKFIFTLTSV